MDYRNIGIAGLLGLLGIAGALAQPTTTKPDISNTLTQCAIGKVVVGNAVGSPPTCTTALSSGQLLIGQSAAIPAPATMSGDATIDSAGALTIGSNKISNAKMATMATSTVKGNFSGSTAAPSDASVPSCASDGTHGLTNPSAGGFACTALSNPSAAVQSDQETATSTSTYVSPGRQQFHPSSPKAWILFNGSTPAITASYNVASLVRNSTGNFTVTFTTAFSSAAYAAICKAGTPGATFGNTMATGGGRTASAYTMTTVAQDFATSTNFTDTECVFFGDQ